MHTLHFLFCFHRILKNVYELQKDVVLLQLVLLYFIKKICYLQKPKNLLT
jgi:hypothetical protein